MAGGGAVKLIGAWPSPFVTRARIAFNLKSVGYEYLEETVGSKSELLLRSNPVYKKIPVLLHDDKPICESLVILEYIDATWGSDAPILPNHPYDQAIARFWACYVDDKWFPTLFALGGAETEEEKAASLRQLCEAAQFLEGAFEKCSQGKGFFGGDRIGYLDIVFGSFMGWTKAAEKMAGVKILDEYKTPLLQRWAERFCAEEAVKGVTTEADKLLEVWKHVQAMFKPSS